MCMRVEHDPEASGLQNILCSGKEGLGEVTAVFLVCSRESEYGDGDDDVVTLLLMMLSVPRVRKAKVAGTRATASVCVVSQNYPVLVRVRVIPRRVTS